MAGNAGTKNRPSIVFTARVLYCVAIAATAIAIGGWAFGTEATRKTFLVVGIAAAFKPLALALILTYSKPVFPDDDGPAGKQGDQ